MPEFTAYQINEDRVSLEQLAQSYAIREGALWGEVAFSLQTSHQVYLIKLAEIFLEQQ